MKNKNKGETMNKEIRMKKIGNEKIKIITKVTGNVDYFLKVDHTGYAEKDWLLITNQELKQLEERA
tara:strand:+ start:129 stop:326 length:198 start_codon:yes stop_codon:yes gene_type:complete